MVDEVQIFNTILVTPDNKKIIVPNGVVTSGIITNISGQGEIRVDMAYGIGYDDDIDQARSIILDVAKRCPQIIQEKSVDVFVAELADSSVNFTVRPWAKSEHYWDVFFFMQEHIKKAMLELEEFDYDQKLVDVLEKKDRTLRESDMWKRRGKLAEHAIRKGFETGLVWETVKRLWPV